jgi:hypothetical protein
MTETYSPPRFEYDPDGVPEELKVDEAWICCDENKVPLVANPSGAVYAASSTDPSTWRAYEQARQAWAENEWSFCGVGRVIRETEDLVGIDFDHCLDPDSGEITPWAESIIRRLDSYHEVSPSLRGIKVWVKAPTITRAHVKPGLEIYPKGRYFTVTGLALGDARFIADRGEALAAIIAEEFPKVARERTPYDGPNRMLDLLDYLEKAQIEIYVEVNDGSAETVYGIRCPWEYEHSKETSITATRVGRYPDGALFFRCEHAHCRDVRGWTQFRTLCDPIVYLGRPRKATGRLR